MSSLPGKALRTRVDIASDSTHILKAEPGKLDYQKTRTWYSIYQFTHCFTLQTSGNVVIFDFYVDSASFKKCNVIMT